MSSESYSYQINPLMFIEFDHSFSQNQLNLQILLGAICWPGSEHDSKDLKNRYDYINKVSNKLKIAPVEKNLLDKIIWPLRQAKASFLLANYLGTISSCGFIAEMITILLYKISPISINASVINENEENKLFGDLFENLGQYRRINVLHALKILDDKKRGILMEIKKIRNQYMHFFTQDYKSIMKDAKRIYEKTEEIVAIIIGQNIRDGKFYLNEDLLRYIKKCETNAEN